MTLNLPIASLVAMLDVLILNEPHILKYKKINPILLEDFYLRKKLLFQKKALTISRTPKLEKQESSSDSLKRREWLSCIFNWLLRSEK